MNKKYLASLFIVSSIAFALGYAVAIGPRLITSWFIGSGEINPEWERLETVKGFDDFYASIGDVRDMVLATAESEQEAIQGMRWILRVASEVTEMTLDNSPDRPRFVRMDSDVRKVGGDNPDGEYFIAPLDGNLTYEITGNRGTVRYFSLNVNAGQGSSRRRMAAFLNDQTINFDEAGNFTLLLSQREPEAEGQWVEIPADASTVMLRIYLANRKTEVPLDISIEVLGGNPPTKPATDQELADTFTNMNYAYIFLSTLHKLVLPESWDNPNMFYSTDSDTLGGSISTPDNLYMIGSFRVADDEALIIEVEPPETRYWNIALSTIWYESSDYMSRQSSLTLEDVATDPDGKVRLVISRDDPGVENWLDPMDNQRGTMVFRWLDARGIEIPTPVTRLVKLTELEAALKQVDRSH